MSILNDYSIPISGLEFGLYHYKFNVSSGFFNSFESSILDNGEFIVDILLDRKPMAIVADIDIKGESRVLCDRCLEKISLPISGHQKYTFQMGNENLATEIEDIDLNIISEEQQELNLSFWIHEVICLSTPILKTYNCEEDPKANCNEDILNKIINTTSKIENDPVWDILKEIKK